MKGLNPHERLAFGLRIPRPTHPQLRQLKGGDTPQEQGHKAWNAGWLLIDFLQRHPPKDGLSVLDIGCGGGTVWALLRPHLQRARHLPRHRPARIPFCGASRPAQRR